MILRPEKILVSERKGSGGGGAGGILRLDGSLRRRGSSNEPSSPSPSADRLSVTFAMDATETTSSGRGSVTIVEQPVKVSQGNTTFKFYALTR